MQEIITAADAVGMVHPKARVIQGPRRFINGTWHRRDKIYLGTHIIGVIHLGEKNRPGTTYCLINSAKKDGYAPTWCLESYLQATAAEAQKGSQELEAA